MSKLEGKCEMVKCELCGNKCKAEIKIEAYNRSTIICGVCALDKEIITVPEIVKRIRKEEGIPERKACILCSHLFTINAQQGDHLCKRYDILLNDPDVKGNYCECFERVRK